MDQYAHADVYGFPCRGMPITRQILRKCGFNKIAVYNMKVWGRILPWLDNLGGKTQEHAVSYAWNVRIAT